LKADALQYAVQLSPTFSRGRHQIAAAKREAAELRGKVKLQPADKTDLVSAMLRAEMRDFLRSKSQAERDAYIRANAENLDPQMALAVMEMPAELSGISTVQRDALIERALEAQHGDALKEVQELERGIEIAERAVQLGREEIIREAEADPHQFNQLAEPFERAAGANWLKKYRENGEEVVRVMKWDNATQAAGRRQRRRKLLTGLSTTIGKSTARQMVCQTRGMQHDPSIEQRPKGNDCILGIWVEWR
jgi:hypothetical protein